MKIQMLQTKLTATAAVCEKIEKLSIMKLDPR